MEVPQETNNDNDNLTNDTYYKRSVTHLMKKELSQFYMSKSEEFDKEKFYFQISDAHKHRKMTWIPYKHYFSGAHNFKIYCSFIVLSS